jgi:hypothetical protein
LKDEIKRLLFLVTIINLMGLCQARGATKVRGTLFFQLTGEGLPVFLISGGELVAKLIRSRTTTCQFCPFLYGSFCRFGYQLDHVYFYNGLAPLFKKTRELRLTNCSICDNLPLEENARS